MPFDEIHFKVLMVEIDHIPGPDPGRRVQTLLNEYGYKLYAIVADLIFVHGDYLPAEFQEKAI